MSDDDVITDCATGIVESLKKTNSPWLSHLPGKQREVYFAESRSFVHNMPSFFCFFSRFAHPTFFPGVWFFAVAELKTKFFNTGSMIFKVIFLLFVHLKLMLRSLVLMFKGGR